MSRNFQLLRELWKEEVLLSRLGDGDSSPSTADSGHSVLAIRVEKPVQDELIQFVQRVFVFANSHAPRAIVFTSAQGNGSSEICSQAARVLAAQGSGSVCIVDANQRTHLLHQLFGVADSPGLADAMARPGPIKESAKRLDGRNLWLAPAGWCANGAQGLLASDRLRARFQELRDGFDYVLIDAPPVNSSADAVLLGQMADGVILVLEANSTRRETARTAKETLEGGNVKLLGAILNNRTFPIPEALYRRL